MFFLSFLLVGLAWADPADAPVDTAACAQSGKLQKKAMLGKLPPELLTCLEARIGTDDPLHVLDASTLLIADAWAKGDKPLWARRVKRHLEFIDETDANFATQYGDWLVEQPGGADEAMAWAEVALAHEYRFDADVRGDRLYTVYGVRARGMAQQWRTAQVGFEASPAEGELRMDSFAKQARARLYAVEWMQHAQSAGRSTSEGFALCVETGWTEQRCAEALEEDEE